MSVDSVVRVALVTNFCPGYRRPLFTELARRVDLKLIFTSRGAEWYWQGERPTDVSGVDSVLAPGPFEVARELRRGTYDAVIASFTGRAVLIAACGTAWAKHLPLVLWVGIWEHPRTYAHLVSRPVARSFYRGADAIVTYGSHVSRFIAAESGRVDKVFVSRQSVDNEHFRKPVPGVRIDALRARLGIDARPTVLFVGRITEEKGLMYLLDASAQVKVNHQIVIAGEGPLQQEVREQTFALGVQDRVRLVGHIEQTELPVLMQASDVLVLPSVSTPRVRETWGLVVNEAMNCALPVVATDAVGAAAGGLVVSERTGLIVPERDSAALARALNDLVGNGDKRERLGEAGRAHVLDWNYGSAVDAFVSALEAARVS